MSEVQKQKWTPTIFLRWVNSVETSTGPAEIVTDAGSAFMKAKGNKEGPHVLACEWIGTKLAEWFGLKTFDISIVQVNETDEIPLGHKKMAMPGSAIVTRKEKGTPWAGDPKMLEFIDNAVDIPDLVVFDNWVLNCDRYPPDTNLRKPNFDNVFFSEENANPGRFVLKAIDHSHCFTCGSELTERKLSNINLMKDERLYGLFPAFKKYIVYDSVKRSLDKLNRLDKKKVIELVESVPEDWEVTRGVRKKMTELILERANFIYNNLWKKLSVECFPQAELDLKAREEVDR
jgi:hypothetical protein